MTKSRKHAGCRSGRLTIIGVDFDNTIASYDQVLFDLALKRGLIETRALRGKRAIRDAVRLLPNGEKEWQSLQAEIYGPAMGRAVLIPGVKDFVIKCKLYRIPIHIISHKTEYANYDQTGTSLRNAAMQWLELQGFLGGKEWSISTKQVHFKSTREAKVEAIKSLGCTHFVDDLVELYEESNFPQEIVKILYTPEGVMSNQITCTQAETWNEITHLIFGE